MISFLVGKSKYAFFFVMYLLVPLTPILAIESRDVLIINMLVNSCYGDIKSCKKSLIKINNYQKNAALNKKFSCQTRLLGLEANLIKAMNYNLKRNEAKNIIDAVKKFC